MDIQPSFTEREPYEKGFAAVFRRDIAPKLDRLERDRLELLEKRKQRVKLSIIITCFAALLWVFLIFYFWSSVISTENSFGMIISILGFLLVILVRVRGGVWVQSLEKGHLASLRDIIIDAVCPFFGELEYFRDPGDRFDHRRFRTLGVVEAGSNSRFEDLFVGRYRDTGYKMVEAVFRSGGSTARTVFDGLLFEIVVPQAFSGRILIYCDEGQIGNALVGFFKGTFGKQKRMVFEHADFEDRYAVYTDDEDEARALVTPGFCRAMVALADAYEDKALSAAFVDSVFLLAVPVAGNLFELGSIKKSVFDCEDDIHEFLKQLTIAHRVIDHLHGDQPERPA